jgi:hypothetical protein
MADVDQRRAVPKETICVAVTRNLSGGVDTGRFA